MIFTNGAIKMKSFWKGFFIFFCIILCWNFLHADERISINKSMHHPDYVWKRIHIKWGIKTKTKQVWDGSAKIDSGYILKVNPFIRRDLLDDSKLVTETSWTSETYSDVEGIFLSIYAPPKAQINIKTITHNFSFRIEDIDKKQKLLELDGDIEITDKTEEILFHIKGLEYGKYGSGSASVSPGEAYVDSIGTWKLTFTAGSEGIPVGGGIRVSWHFTRDWGKPQFNDPKALNYVTVKSIGEAKLEYKSEHRGLFEYPFNQGRILVRVLDKPIKAGEQIIIILGDKSRGSPGFQAPIVSEKNFSFRIESCTEVPKDGFPVYRRINELPSLQIKTRLKAKRLFAVAPSLVKIDQPFTLKLIAEDKYRNTVEHYSGTVNVYAESSRSKKHLAKYKFKKTHRGLLTIENLRLDLEGAWRLKIEDESGLLTISNPIHCQKDDNYRLFWGELHGHTQNSDGYGSAEEYFTFARTKAALDFAAITDHDVELDAPDYKVSEMWEEVNKAVARFNNPPQFLTLLAYEWSPARITETTKYPYGDHNVFYFQDEGYIFPTGDRHSNTQMELNRELKKLPLETMVKVIPHVGGAIGNWEIHDPDLVPLGEIYSVHGSFEQFGQIALDKGYHIGFVGAADAHNGQIGGFPPGNSANHFVHGGLTGIYAKELSRRELYEAISSRRVFATTGKRIIVDFTINDHEMGEEITVLGKPKIKAFAIGEKPIWKIELVKNGKVIHAKLNSFENSNIITFLWKNHVEKNDLLNFDKGFWSRRLRGVQWQGKIISTMDNLKLITPYSFDYPKDRILTANADTIIWQSETRGDYDGVEVRVHDPVLPLTLALVTREISTFASSAGFRLTGENLQRRKFTITPSEIPASGEQLQIGSSDFVSVIKGEPSRDPLIIDFTDTGLMQPENYYYLRVTQIDGEMAWSSPIWVQGPLHEE